MLKRFLIILGLLAQFMQPAFAQSYGTTQGTWAGTANASVMQFCSANDGSIDNTPCIQAALNDLCAHSAAGGTMYFPPGWYNISASVGVSVPCEGVWLKGAGYGEPTATRGTMIEITGSGNAPIFNFNGTRSSARNYVYGCGVRDMIFDASGNSLNTPTQTGPMIKFNACYNGLVENVFGNQVFQLLFNFAGYHNTIRDSIADKPPKGAELIRYEGSDSACTVGAACLNRGDLFFIDTVQVNDGFGTDGTKNNSTCVHITNYAASTSITHLVCNQNHIGLWIDCPSAKTFGDCPSFINLYDFQTEPDGTSGDTNSFGILASDYEYLTCVNCYVHGNYNSGTSKGVLQAARFYAVNYAPAGPTTIIGGRYDTAAQQCILTNQYGFTMQNAIVYNCNKGGAASTSEAYYGLAVETNISGTTAGSGSTLVQANEFCNYLQVNSTAMGAFWSGLVVDVVNLLGNNFRGCTVDTMITNGSVSRFNNLNNLAH